MASKNKIRWTKNKKFKRNPHRLSKDRPYPLYGNLAAQFFNESDIEGRPFLFYFDFLLSDYVKKGEPQIPPEYNQYAHDIGNKAKNSLSASGHMLDTEDSRVLEQYEQLLKILSGAVEYERKNEIDYFNQKIKSFKEKFTKEEIAQIPSLAEIINNYQAAQPGEVFPYEELIILINELYQGLDNAKAVFQYESQRLQEIHNLMEQAQHSYMNSLEGYARAKRMSKEEEQALYERGEKKRDAKIRSQYLKKAQVHDYKGLSGIKNINRTATVEIAHWITDSVKKLFEDDKMHDEVLLAIKKHFGEEKAKELAEQDIQEIVIKTYMTYATKNISKIIDRVYDKQAEDILFSTVQESMSEALIYDIEGFYSNFGQFGRNLKYYDEADEAEEEVKASAQGLYDALENFYKRANAGKKNLREDEQALWNFVNYGRKEDKFGPTIDLIHDLESILKKINGIAEQLKKNGENVTQLYEAVIRENKKNENYTGDNVKISITYENGEISVDYQALLEQIQGSKGLANMGDTRLRAKTLDGIITGLKTRVSNKMKHELDQVKKQVLEGSKDETSSNLLAAYQSALENVRISVGGAALEEIIQGLQITLREQTENASKKIHSGKSPYKNDFMTIDAMMPTNELTKSSTDELNNQTSEMSNRASSEMNKLAREYVEEFGSEFLKALKEQKSYNNVTKNADLFLNRKTSKEADTLVDRVMKNHQPIEALDELDHTIEGEKARRKAEIQQKQAFLEQLKDSFFESSTMKTYNEYQDNIGFIGGSIGSNLLRQLDTLYQLFVEAGIDVTPDDFKWLARAIINCSPDSVIGDSNKDVIENYLGALATFALFDEGGAELAIINEIVNKTDTNYLNTTPRILHLYKVNGIYYPGSYVLTQVREQIQSCLTSLQDVHAQLERSNSVSIENHINKSMLPNKNRWATDSNGKYLPPKDNDPWGSVGQTAAYSSSIISIHVIFLGGIMDILKRVNETMEKIDLP